MRNAQAALWGIVCAVVATMLGALLYDTVRTGALPKSSDAILLIQLALFGWYLYLIPGAALGIGTRPLLRRFGAFPGTLLMTVLAALGGVVVGYLFSYNATHVSMNRAMGCLACSWGIIALIVLALISKRLAGSRT